MLRIFFSRKVLPLMADHMICIQKILTTITGTLDSWAWQESSFSSMARIQFWKFQGPIFKDEHSKNGCILCDDYNNVLFMNLNISGCFGRTSLNCVSNLSWDNLT